jgi:site-specific recombinase XerD
MPTEDFQKRIEQTTENIADSDDIGETNKELLRDYKRDQMLNGLSDATLLKNLTRLKIVAENTDKSFDEMDAGDVKDIVAWIQSQDYADSTIYTYKNVICGFWQWLSDSDDPEATNWIQLKNPSESDTLPQDLLTKEDIERQIEAAKNPRDKAFIALLYETGARIGELIDLTVGDIEDRNHGRKVVIDGKTGSRRLPLIESVPYINQWLNKHPNPEKDAPLWCKIQQGGPDDQLGYRYIRDKILKKNMERAGIDKDSNPHHYRHSRASELATEMTEAQLCEWFGWVQGSDVPARYVHLSGRDLDDSYDQLHGLYEPDEDEQQPDVVECPRCSELNQPEATFCMQCGFGLDQETAEQFEAKTDEDIKQDYQDIEPGDNLADKLETLDSLMDDPDVKSFLEQKQ